VSKRFRSWVLLLGFLLVLIACIAGYFSTKSVEADVSMNQDLMYLSAARNA